MKPKQPGISASRTMLIAGFMSVLAMSASGQTSARPPETARANVIPPAVASPDWTVGLQELDLGQMRQGWGSPRVNKAVSGAPLAISGRKFTSGVGTHALGKYALDLRGTARRFSAWVGVDDSAKAPGSVTFQVVGDHKILWESGVMRAGEPAKEVGVDLQGIHRLTLLVGDAGDGINMDRADWAEARIDGQGLKPSPSTDTANEIDLRKLRTLNLTPKATWSGTNPAGDHLAANAEYLMRNGKPWIMVAGEMHPTRYPREQWEEQILKMKAGGLNTIASYFFWMQHEEDEGVFTWTGQRDMRHFIELCAKHGMYVFARIGPFCNGEVKNGGLPDFLKAKGVKFRTNDPVYFDYVRKWYQQVGQQLKGLMFKDGGPVVAVQLENEFEHAPTSWGFVGSGGEEHMLILKRMAIETGMIAPYYVCTAWGSPVPPGEMLPVLGGYVWMSPGKPTSHFLFKDKHSGKRGKYDATQYPVANVETGPGFFCYGQWRPTIPPESSEAIAMMMTACGGNVLGYYMYQSGSQFIGKRGSTGAPASYDFQGPLREFGQANAIYDYLKPVNFFLDDFGDLLAPMVVALPENPVSSALNVSDLRYGARAYGESGFLFLNNYQDRLNLPDRHNLSVNLILADKTMRIPEQGGFDLQQHQFVVLPFNLTMEGAHLDYALAQLFTRTRTNDGRTVYVFFVPEGMNGHYVFASETLAELKAKSATVAKKGARTIVSVQPGTDCLMQVKSTSGQAFEILTLTRRQALRLTRQDVFGRQRLVLSDSDIIAAGGKLRVSKIGGAKLDFAVFPAPTTKLVAETGAMLQADGEADGVFRRYTIRVAEVKPDITFEGIGSTEVKIKAAPTALDGVNDVFLRVIYLGNVARLKQDGTLLCENLFNRTPWDIGLKRFRGNMAGSPLLLGVEPPAPIVEVVNNLTVNSAAVNLTLPKSDMLVGNYEVTPALPASESNKGYVSSVKLIPEYAVWVHAAAGAANQPADLVKPKPSEIVPLWPGDPPGLLANARPETFVKEGFGNVSVPQLLVYLPPQEKRNGISLIICAGGGYSFVGMGAHVENVVRTLNDQGITVFGLKYRTNYGKNNVEADALADGKRAVRLVRSRAAQWNIAPDRVGIQGYSAGANLCLNLISHFDGGDAKATDKVERFSSRPDFCALMSCWPFGKTIDYFPLARNVPPTWIASARNDTIAPFAFSQAIADKLKALGVIHEIFAVETNGHAAFHYGKVKGPGGHWPEPFFAWLRKIGMIKVEKTTNPWVTSANKS